MSAIGEKKHCLNGTSLSNFASDQDRTGDANILPQISPDIIKFIDLRLKSKIRSKFFASPF